MDRPKPCRSCWWGEHTPEFAYQDCACCVDAHGKCVVCHPETIVDFDLVSRHPLHSWHTQSELRRAAELSGTVYYMLLLDMFVGIGE